MPSGILQNEKVDLLNRRDFVGRMITISEMLSANKKNACYALNGSWGVGKSFVLGMFEEQVIQIQTPETTMGKYLLFHYDCWKYDYYEEPLTAIVAALLDSIDEQVHLFSEEKRTKIKGILKVIGVKIAEKVNEIIEEKTGIDPKDIWDLYNGVNEEAAKKIADNHAFDTYFDFNKILKKLRETIASLAQDQTVILVVDELDRCLPEYTIKVMERLHHVFDDIPNVQMILSIDKEQLKHTIRQIYGENTSAERYLAKFIDFEIKLDEGTLSDISDERFREYTRQFKLIDRHTMSVDVDQFVTMFFDGVDMRIRLALIEKAKMIHHLLANDTEMDFSIMCIEMLLVLFHSCGIHLARAKKYIPDRVDFSPERRFTAMEFSPQLGYENGNLQIFASATRGLAEIGEAFNGTYRRDGTSQYYQMINEHPYINTSGLWGKLFGVYRYLIGFEDDWWEYTDQRTKELEYTRKFWELLQIIS